MRQQTAGDLRRGYVSTRLAVALRRGRSCWFVAPAGWWYQVVCVNMQVDNAVCFSFGVVF